METIKVSVDVNINLSNDVKQFLTSLFTPPCSCTCGCDCTTYQEPVPGAKPDTKPGTKSESEAKPAPDAKPAPEAKPAPVKPEITITMVREIVSKKSATHREELRAKLNEFGAKNVGTLAPEHYEEFYNYAQNL